MRKKLASSNRFSNRNIVRLLIVAGLILILAIPVIVYIQAEVAYQYRKANFCTPNDEVYQTIVINYESWINYYRPLIGSTDFASPRLVIIVPSGKSYTVNADLWKRESDTPQFFMVTETAWQENFGNNGYFYSPMQPPTIDDRYHVEAISEGIYCYRFKTPEEYTNSS